MEEQEKEKRRLVIEKFQKAPFEEIAAQCESKVSEQMVKGMWGKFDSVDIFLVISWWVPYLMQIHRTHGNVSGGD